MTTPVRFLAVLLTTTASLLIGATAASADEPVGWPESPTRSTLDTLLLFGGATVGLFVVIVLFALLTARRNYTPPPPGSDVVTSPDATADRH
jgi:heme/copper-type cytochrome/quinol oxidase subunit 2